MSKSGYTLCPCCGYDTISSDMSEPELCSDCEDAGCDADACDCQVEFVEMSGSIADEED